MSSTDRKKDLVKISTGEYISLGKVESVLKQIPYIDNCCVYVDGAHAFVVVLVVPNAKHIKTLAATVSVNSDSNEELCNDKRVVKALLGAIEAASKGGRCTLVPTSILLKIIDHIYWLFEVIFYYYPAVLRFREMKNILLACHSTYDQG